MQIWLFEVCAVLDLDHILISAPKRLKSLSQPEC